MVNYVRFDPLETSRREFVVLYAGNQRGATEFGQGVEAINTRIKDLFSDGDEQSDESYWFQKLDLDHLAPSLEPQFEYKGFSIDLEKIHHIPDHAVGTLDLLIENELANRINNVNLEHDLPIVIGPIDHDDGRNVEYFREQFRQKYENETELRQDEIQEYLIGMKALITDDVPQHHLVVGATGRDRYS